MEPISAPLASGPDASSPPLSKRDVSPFSGGGASLKPNQVSETSLYGVPIVSLVIDGQERLCLAQISNTLLKSYSYNEIHNRRVALGITCVQCTPVQLEILRRAGAMPISSRRCGMITKREAERLCKSFLGAHTPPKLPENFAFDVSHECAWGCRGNFIPARYNSSRAKCIKCAYCSMYFSPNKFIFHSHRTPESKYTQPDAANFNSWRRHLKLTDKLMPDDISHAWEDVKAMFNGGSRKRTMPGSGCEMSPLKTRGPGHVRQASSPEIPHKSLRCDDERANLGLANGARNYPVIPVPSKSFGMLQKIPPPLFPHPYGFSPFGLCQKKDDGTNEQNKTGVPGVFWAGTKDSLYPSFPMFWPTTGALPLPPYQHAQQKPHELTGSRQSETDVAEHERPRSSTPRDNERCSSSQSLEDKSADELRSTEGHATSPPRKSNYVSAFRPVVKDAESIAKLYGNRDAYAGPPAGHLSPDFVSETSSYRSASPEVDSGGEPEVDVESNQETHDDDEESVQLSVEDRQSPVRQIVSRAGHGEEVRERRQEEEEEEEEEERHQDTDEDRLSDRAPKSNDTPTYDVCAAEKDAGLSLNSPPVPAPKYPPIQESHNSHRFSHAAVLEDDWESQKSRHDQISVSKEAEIEGASRADGRFQLIEKNIEHMAKEELQKQLVEQMELRKKMEREFQNLKDNFQDQMKRELSYREEMVQQLQIVRDTLCNELDQERKARYAIQQKLKEAHDALHHFSCKMLTPRHCTGTCTFKPPLLPP
ncbi:SKI family transcriptional corepressor 1a isoform X1 [Pangasianodon hypophthalmus]|uniref:SKI family transcriptional corepressor 1a isoform X1 n=1 Tax=Pangasianodon hypophthalmus TaxID=310915 RepID=UPI00147BA379|nr:SKI family transcriptional corepressor 1a isoform X1 [Pangasianodon hypophthalmus]